MALLEHREDHSARLRHADGARGVAAHEELFERCLRRLMFGDQRTQMGRYRHEPRTFPTGNRGHGAAGDDAIGLGEQREARAREAGIDSYYQPVSWHWPIQVYTCAETLSRMSAAMSKSAGKGRGPIPRAPSQGAHRDARWFVR